MPFENFEAVATLDVPAQRELLSMGDPAERVWAAWALGLRLGATAVPELLASLHTSPSPGTRRHLIVVLAGLGERTLLQALTEHDPDELVRATAYEYLVRTVAPSDEATLRAVAERLLQDESPEVRQTVLRVAQTGVPMLNPQHLTPLAHDPDREARQLAVDALLRSAALHELFPGVLEDRIPLEPDPELRRRLAELCLAAGGAERLVHLAVGLADSRRIEFLRLLAQHQQRLPWEHLTPLSLLREPEVDSFLVRLVCQDDAPRAFGWLLSCVARAITWPSPRNRPESETYRLVHECADEAARLLCQAAPNIRPAQLGALERKMIQAIVGHLEDYRRYVEDQRAADEALEEDTDWYHDEGVQNRLRLLSELRRLSGADA